jgi:PilZ domain
MPEAEFRVPRAAPRFSFIAEAEVTWPKDQTRVVARISELSSRGCYVDTVNPFPMDTELHFLIRYGCSTCELPGKVIYTHSGYGMGVLFGEIGATHRATLNGWLDELARKSG